MSKESFYKSRILIIILFATCVLLSAKIVYDTVDKAALIEEGEAKGVALQSAYQSIDSIQREISAKIIAIEELGGQVDTLLRVREELEQERATLRQRSRNEIAELRNKVEGYSGLLLEKDAEIVRLKEVNEILLGENTTLKVTQSQLRRSISSLEDTQDKLQEKVSIASRLEITTPEIQGMNRKGKPLRRLRADAVKLLKVSFSIKANEVAEADGKEVLLRIIAPNNRVLFDVNRGAGSFTKDGKEHFYTLKQDILYDKRSQQVSYLYDKQTPYQKGTYRVEVYTDGYLMGKSSFELK